MKRPIPPLVFLAAAALAGCGKDALDPFGSRPAAAAKPDEVPVPAQCVGQRVIHAQDTYGPADIIWVVDSSRSMDFELTAVQDNLNAFSQTIATSGVDYRVVLIGDASKMVVPPPLGGSPQFLQIDVNVGSHDALDQIIAEYPEYKQVLRPDSVKHFVVVSDDEADMTAGAFTTALASLSNPGFAPKWVFHSIVSYGDDPDRGCDTGSGYGQRYLDLSAQTGGVTAPVCQVDWSPIFTAVEQQIILSAGLPCAFDLPDLPAGATLVPEDTEVRMQSGGGAVTTVPEVSGAGACAGSGWYYDSPTRPTQVIACAATCDALRADTGGAVQIVTTCTP